MPIVKKSVVSTFSLAMMTAAAVVSLRGLPMMAKEQLTLFVYIAFATFIFLIPAALVSAELGGAFGEKGGGVYTWVKEAFGARWGFVAIWLQWIQNVVWYPTVLAFSAAAIAYVVGEPTLANNGPFVGRFASSPIGPRHGSRCRASARSHVRRAKRSSRALCCPV